MKQKFIALFVICMIGMVSLFAEDATKPQKRTPVVDGNFEITQGYAVTARPIDMDKLHHAIVQILLRHGYVITSDKPGVIEYSLKKNDWSLKMKFCYWTDEYWYEYVDSWNLGANPVKNKIHKNYPRWIAIIEKELISAY